LPELQRLRTDHAQSVLAFEVANRAYFARSISDRGDAFFAEFNQRHAARLAEQAAGTGAYYVLVSDDGEVMGRFNLIVTGDGTADLGYRMAERFTGRGVATEAVREVCRLASSQHDLRTIRAATSTGNVASQRVLLKAGFAAAGPADPADVGGRSGTWYQLDLGST
jgi:[ribosomal protein S5]-alanine N-acetyltransferase